MATPGNGRGPLAIGGAAAVLASACCLGPLLLLTLGISGAWIGGLAALAPYRPVFIAVAVLALYFAYRRIFRAPRCEPDAACANTKVGTVYKVLFWIVALLVLIAFAFPYAAPLFY